MLCVLQPRGRAPACRINEVCVSDPECVLSSTHRLLVAMMRVLPPATLATESSSSLGPCAASTVVCRVLSSQYASPGQHALWTCLQEDPSSEHEEAGTSDIDFCVLSSSPSLSQQMDCCRIAAAVAQLAHNCCHAASVNLDALVHAGASTSADLEEASQHMAGLQALCEKGLVMVSLAAVAYVQSVMSASLRKLHHQSCHIQVIHDLSLHSV